jgi:PAS domain S-box-containing protein
MGVRSLETKKINLQSVVDTHEQPFVIIDRDFTIVAVNRAYEQAYGSTREKMVGQHCYQVSHQNDKPCFEFGEDCPHQTVYESGQGCSCLHIHYDTEGRARRVRINAYPLVDGGGDLYLGEAVQDLSESDGRRNNRIRMVGQSPIFLRMLEQLKLAAAADAPILLQGETGTGKDLAANFIHQHSSRHDKPFLTLDCTVLTESLFEAEVFGHERGAFTGSVGEKKGLFEVVNGGTLFLDEIGEMPSQLQAKLLRVLETGEYRRVGGHKTLHANARIICATNRNLGSDMETKDFREDLYYRIACLHIQVPNLRERLQDVPLLAETLLDAISQSTGRRYQLTANSLMELQTYHYPGNIRELRNILSVAAAQVSDGHLDAKNIADVVRCMKSRRRVSRTRRASDTGIEENRSQATVGSGTQAIEKRRLSDVGLDRRGRPETASAATASSATATTDEHNLQTMEAQHIARLLKQHHGNRREVAAALGISERTMYRKLKRYGLT